MWPLDHTTTERSAESMCREVEKPLPFTLPFREMTKPELRKYFQWFMDVLPQRVDELGRTVKKTPGFAVWEPDFTPESLDMLGEWFAGEVEIRSRTREEIQTIQSNLAFPIDVKTWDLSDRTFCIAGDVGMYFSQVLLRNHPSLRWDQPFGSRRYAEFGQPVIAGFGAVQLNPMRIVSVLAYSFAEKTKDSTALRKVYEVWSADIG